jgi:hypothetical protein
MNEVNAHIYSTYILMPTNYTYGTIELFLVTIDLELP